MTREPMDAVESWARPAERPFTYHSPHCRDRTGINMYELNLLRRWLDEMHLFSSLRIERHGERNRVTLRVALAHDTSEIEAVILYRMRQQRASRAQVVQRLELEKIA